MDLADHSVPTDRPEFPAATVRKRQGQVRTLAGIPGAVNSTALELLWNPGDPIGDANTSRGAFVCPHLHVDGNDKTLRRQGMAPADCGSAADFELLDTCTS